MQLYCDRYLTDKVVPGNRVTVIGIYSIRKAGLKPAKVRGRRVHAEEGKKELMGQSEEEKRMGQPRGRG